MPRTKEELFDELWDNWNFIINEYLDQIRDLAHDDLMKRTPKELRELIKENNELDERRARLR